MTRYIANQNPNSPGGEHEVHKDNGTCIRLPLLQNRIALGDFQRCIDALNEARRRFPGKQFDGCYYCSNECHTK
jgi:hypothetical protein